MELLLISGLSGAGKSMVSAALEDMGYYCVDNLPVALIPRLAELALADTRRYERVAIVSDVRAGAEAPELFGAIETAERMGCDVKILFIEASMDTIVRRYKETRRLHPLDTGGVSTEEAVRRETELMADVRGRADYVVNTTGYSARELQRELQRLFTNGRNPVFNVSVMSFGFKYGLPLDADMVLDARCLPNPYYVPELKKLSGLDAGVRDYVFAQRRSELFFQRLAAFVEHALPMYAEEGRHSLVIAVGCTGGRHRSVATAERLTADINALGFRAESRHRDMEKG